MAKKRVRKRSVEIQLQEALNTAQTLETAEKDELSIARIKLAQTRLNILNKMLARDRTGKLERALKEVATLRAENEQLRHQHEQDAAEIERLISTTQHDEIGQALKKFREENGNANQEQVA